MKQLLEFLVIVNCVAFRFNVKRCALQWNRGHLFLV